MSIRSKLTCSMSTMPLISCWSVPRGSGARQFAVRRDGKPLHLHSLDDVGVALVLGTVGKLLLLRAKETRCVLPIRLVKIARPEIIRLHHVKVAVEDQITLTCHFHLRGIFGSNL